METGTDPNSAVPAVMEEMGQDVARARMKTAMLGWEGCWSTEKHRGERVGSLAGLKKMRKGFRRPERHRQRHWV